MTVLNKAKEHFKEIANKGQAHLDVPEWGTVVYWNISGLNFAQQSKADEYLAVGWGSATNGGAYQRKEPSYLEMDASLTYSGLPVNRPK